MGVKYFMFKTFPIFLSFFISVTGFSAINPKIPCFNALMTSLDAVGTVTEWMPFPGGVAGLMGKEKSVEVHYFDQQVDLIVKTIKSTSEFNFKMPACKAQLKSAMKNKNQYDDSSFARDLKDNQSGGMVLIWSPHMELSISEVKALVNRKLKYPVRVLLDPKTDFALASKVAKKNNLPVAYLKQLASRSLIHADILIHFPSVVFYKKGKILKRVPGYNGNALDEMSQKILGQ